MKRFLFSAVVVFCCCSFVLAAHQIQTVFPEQKGSPLRIVGVLNTSQDLARRIEIQNLWMAKAVEVRVGWIAEAPVGCSRNAMTPILEFGRPEEISIEPGAKYATLAYRIGMRRMLHAMHVGETEHLYIQFGIVYARFADGTKWQFDLKKEGSFDHHVFLGEHECTPEVERSTRATEDQLRNDVQAGGRGKVWVLSPDGSVAPLVKFDPDVVNLNRALRSDADYLYYCEWLCEPASGENCARYHGIPGQCELDAHGYCCDTSFCATGGVCRNNACYGFCIC
jgi:hypothetical protein